MGRYDMNMNNAFTNIDESDDNNTYEENNVNSLKLRSLVEDEFYAGNRIDEEFRSYSLKKKKEKRKRKKPGEEPKKISNRKIVNLPASQPYIKIMDGEERLCFKYNTKVSESAMNAMPKAELEESEFAVRFDLESVDITKLNEKFKADNCVYPRANIPYEMYMGNRWNYETECNRLAWQFVSLNPVLLYGKRGLSSEQWIHIGTLIRRVRVTSSTRTIHFTATLRRGSMPHLRFPACTSSGLCGVL